MKAPTGKFRNGFNLYQATGEFRPPKKGEHYLSGAIVEVYDAPNDLSQPFWIATKTKDNRIMSRRSRKY